MRGGGGAARCGNQLPSPHSYTVHRQQLGLQLLRHQHLCSTTSTRSWAIQQLTQQQSSSWIRAKWCSCQVAGTTKHRSDTGQARDLLDPLCYAVCASPLFPFVCVLVLQGRVWARADRLPPPSSTTSAGARQRWAVALTTHPACRSTQQAPAAAKAATRTQHLGPAGTQHPTKLQHGIYPSLPPSLPPQPDLTDLSWCCTPCPPRPPAPRLPALCPQALWVSVSADLVVDARRDIEALGMLEYDAVRWD